MSRGRWRSWEPVSPGWWPTLAGTLVAIGAQQACGLTTSDSSSVNEPRPDSGVTADAGGTTPDAGDAGATLDAGCAVPRAEVELFVGHAVPFPSGAPRVFYSWTTAEQVAELRANQVLFSRTEREGLGPGYAFEALANFSTSGTELEHQLARVLGEELFVTARFAWTNAWATRLGIGGEDYGDQLLTIRLRPEAWMVIFDGTSLYVRDASDQQVPREEALATPERIGGIYFLRGGAIGGPSCNPTFFEGADGYREFILGNIGMVEEWSLGTEALRQHLESEIARLEQFIALLRACPQEMYSAGWNRDVVCGWAPTPYATYENTLALPSELYFRDPNRLVQLVATLRAALFEIEPLVVRPND
jgi:hypothetical protein